MFCLTFDTSWLCHVISVSESELAPGVAPEGEDATGGKDERRMFVTAGNLTVCDCLSTDPPISKSNAMKRNVLATFCDDAVIYAMHHKIDIGLQLSL